MLKQMVAERWIKAHAAYAFFEAHAAGDDMVLNSEDETTVIHSLRQQHARKGPNYALADFIAPEGHAHTDHLGAFIVTTGDGIEAHLSQFKAQQDDFSAIMLQALADRLAEALAEKMHQQARKDWQLGDEQDLSLQDLVKERYQGIRPAPGYPACPDHTEKRTLFRLLDADQIGVTLTEHCAMYPAASVSGWYFSHPESRYFSLGKIRNDQLSEYAQRKNWTANVARQWLRPNLEL